MREEVSAASFLPFRSGLISRHSAVRSCTRAALVALRIARSHHDLDRFAGG